jgi:hypothetical protein
MRPPGMHLLVMDATWRLCELRRSRSVVPGFDGRDGLLASQGALDDDPEHPSLDVAG